MGGGAIKQSDAPIIQSRLKMDRQLLGSEKETGPRQRRDGERERGMEGIVSGGADAPVCCHCASVIAGGQVCQDGAAFPQRPQPLCWNAPQRKLKPGTGSDGWTETLFPSPFLKFKAVFTVYGSNPGCKAVCVSIAE